MYIICTRIYLLVQSVTFVLFIFDLMDKPTQWWLVIDTRYTGQVFQSRMFQLPGQKRAWLRPGTVDGDVIAEQNISCWHHKERQSNRVIWGVMHHDDERYLHFEPITYQPIRGTWEDNKQKEETCCTWEWTNENGTLQCSRLTQWSLEVNISA